MEVDYYQKYLQLKVTCKKHEATISKLQKEIRQRCQSYLLYSSRYKKNYSNFGDTVNSSKKDDKSDTSQYLDNSISESKVNPYHGSFTSREKDQKSTKQIKFSTLQLSKLSQVKKFIVKNQFTMCCKPEKQVFQKEQEEKEQVIKLKDRVIEQQKERFSKVKQQKNAYAKEIQKIKQNYQQSLKNLNDLEKKLQLSTKNEKKLEEKLSTIQNFQQKISELYELMKGRKQIKRQTIPKSTKQKFDWILSMNRLGLASTNPVAQKPSSPRVAIVKSEDEVKLRQKEMEIQYLQKKIKIIEKKLKDKDTHIEKINSELLNAKELLLKSKVQIEARRKQIAESKQELKKSKCFEQQKEQVMKQLEKSRSIIDELQNSKFREAQQKDSINQSNKKSLNNSFTVDRPLEQPYYIEEDLYHDPKDQYVKRSFIRKKIVRRNYSATSFRVNSKDKESMSNLVNSKILESSQDKDKIKESFRNKIQQLKTTIPNTRISEVSEQNRQSNYLNNDTELIKVVQVQTKTSKENISTKKMYIQA